MKKKRALTLIEMVISLGLLSLLLSTLFFWYTSISKHHIETMRIKSPLYEERCLSQRLQKILSNAVGTTPFYYTDKSIVFFFDRGLCEKPLLSGIVLAKLYHDTYSQSLCMTLWPNPQGENGILRTPSQTLVLLDQVSELSFAFYNPPDPLRKPVSPEEVGNRRPIAGWQTEWFADYKKLPALIKLDITRTKSPSRELVFDLSMPIIYPGDHL